MSDILALLAGKYAPVPTSPPPPSVTGAAGGTPTVPAIQQGGRQHYSQHAEVARICALPVNRRMAPPELEEFCRQHMMAEAFAKGDRLKPEQAEALKDFMDFFYTPTGALIPIGVGGGKTATCFGIADFAHRNGIKKSVLFVPPELVHQTLGRGLRESRYYIPVNLPIHSIHGLSKDARARLAASGKSGLYVFPYSLLSAVDAFALLEAISPDLILCDEAHLIANDSAARTKRLKRYVEARRPKGVCLSGTITSKSIKDYHHLASWCLHDKSPLPLSRALAEEWGSVIDAIATTYTAPPNAAAQANLNPLVAWAADHFPGVGQQEGVAAYREAYRLRLTSAKGVISSGANTLGTSLTFANRPVEDHQNHPQWEPLAKLINQVISSWKTPNGDEIEHAIHTWKWLYELSAGFYNQLLWQEPAHLARLRQISEGAAMDLLDRALEHFEKGQAYASKLRKFLEKNQDMTVDSPMKAGQEMHLHGSARVPHDLYQAWKTMKDLEFEGMPERQPVPVRVCDYKIVAVCEWVLNLPAGEGALIWCHHIEFGQWLQESLESLGVNSVNRPSDEQIENPENRNRIFIVSVRKYGVGKNLQHFQNQYVAQWPRQAKAAEQCMGRCHRTGQKADALIVTTNNTLDFDHLNFSACLGDSLYLHQTTGVAQKLIYGNYDPTPLIFPQCVINERGFEATRLSREQEQLLVEKFGPYQQIK